jgi:hypothetical protein
MTTPKKPNRFVPSKDHSITVGEAHQIAASISVYGNLITGISATPAELGTVHPQGKDEPLYLSLVVGTSDQGRCLAVNPPQRVYMPHPDGPADGCNWDPAKYVVWKNLPRDWTTVHVQSQPKPLATALAPKAAGLTSASTPYLQDVLKNDWLKSSQPAAIGPDDQLGTLWANYGVGDYTNQVAQNLANAIKKEYRVSLGTGDLPASLKFSALEGIVGVA